MHDPLPLPTDRRVWSFDDLGAEAARRDEGLRCVGVKGAGVALAIRAVASSLGRPVVAVTSDPVGARTLLADLRAVLGDRPCWLLDPGDGNPWAETVPDRQAAQQRVAALHRLACMAEADTPVIVLPAAALVRRVVPAARILAATETLAVGDEIDRDELVRRRVEAGYLRVPLVEDPGTLSVRGGIVDLWPPGAPEPVRIEVDFETVASLKGFDPESQRTTTDHDHLQLLPAREALADDPAEVRSRLRDCCDAVNWPSAKTRSLIDDLTSGRAFFGADGFLPAFTALEPLVDQLPRDAVVVLEEPRAVAEALQAELDAATVAVHARRDDPHFPLEAFYVDEDAVDAFVDAHRWLALSAAPILGDEARVLRAPSRVEEDTPSLATDDQTALVRALAATRTSEGQGAGLETLVTRVEGWQEQGLRVAVAARTTTQAERLASMLGHRGVDVAVDEDHERDLLAATDPARVTVVVSPLARGAVAPTAALALLTEEEVFGARSHRRKAKKPGKRKTQQLLEDLRSLAVGDHVVHVEHGIGRYGGLLHREVAGNTVDLMVVEYAGGDKLYLPVYRLNQIHKFRGGEGSPKLDRLGGQSFARTKRRAQKKVRDIADQLLKLYAERAKAVGTATPPVDDEVRAFEAAFPYEETDDQARAITDVYADLELERPMDRLVCGDVGFGKTEVALRAAFRVAMSGRQVAVLCPTTVLAQQHARTFRARFEGYPLEVRAMSRFQSKKQQTATAKGLRKGTVDVVVGTHRLLSKDVHFKSLGLLVVDEEQRFGVTAKERIKSLRTNVDVLTLSATPIPRTMQMAITGLRDLSVMTTPPVDRRAVRTVVARHDPTLLREALERELGRGGQVFFVYNRVGGLEERAALVHSLVPEARIGIAHGQMREAGLEKVMLQFVEGELDVLVTTAIIENGLDIPRANTIVIDRADLLGLSQLYQLRGRVGRSKERGYCYLVLPPGGGLTDEARLRLEALQRYSDLGAGFQLASLDLDLRGGGDLLGAEQSGTIATIGVEMFASMLERASAELRGEEVDDDLDPELSFDVEALLPESYVHDVGVRLSLYKRLASARDEQEVDELGAEMEDRFGRPPGEARRFVALMRLKVELRRLRVLACEASRLAVTFHLREDTPLDPAKIGELLSKGKVPLKLTPDMRLTRKAREGELFADGIAHTEQLVHELARCRRDA